MFKTKNRPKGNKKQEQDDIPETGEDTVVVRANKQQKFALSEREIAASSKQTNENKVQQSEILSVVSDGFGVTALQLSGKEAATRTFNVDADTSVDQRAINERNLKIQQDIQDGKIADNVYRGQNARKVYTQIDAAATSKSKVTGTMGPVRANTTIRSAARMDNWGTSGDGGVCKEYKMTGFCGYGDSCLYMHDRSVYKSGWQLDRDFEAKQKKIQEKRERKLQKINMMCKQIGPDGKPMEVDENDLSTSSSSEEDTNALIDGEQKRRRKDKDEDKMPASCGICTKSWQELKTTTQPIHTSCGHFFCEKCIMDHYRKSKNCPTCKIKMDGIFNNAEDIWEKQVKKKAEEKVARENRVNVKTGKSGVGLENLLR